MSAALEWDDYWLGYARDNPEVATLARQLCQVQGYDPDKPIAVADCARGPRDSWLLPRRAAPLWSRWVADAVVVRWNIMNNALVSAAEPTVPAPSSTPVQVLNRDG